MTLFRNLVEAISDEKMYFAEQTLQTIGNEATMLPKLDWRNENGYQ